MGYYQKHKTMSHEKPKKPRTEKQLAATAALVARNKARAEQKKAEQMQILEQVNLKISQISGDADSETDSEVDSDLEAQPQKQVSESSESESESSQSESDSEEETDEDESANTYEPKDFTSNQPDTGYMTQHEQENVEAKRKRPLNKGLLYKGW